jgi:hypothetical protein
MTGIRRSLAESSLASEHGLSLRLGPGFKLLACSTSFPPPPTRNLSHVPAWQCQYYVTAGPGRCGAGPAVGPGIPSPAPAGPGPGREGHYSASCAIMLVDRRTVPLPPRRWAGNLTRDLTSSSGTCSGNDHVHHYYEPPGRRRAVRPQRPGRPSVGAAARTREVTRASESPCD